MNRVTKLGILAAMCCISVAATAQTKLTLGYSGANAFMAAFVAKDQGFFAKRGLDVTLQLVPVSATIPAAVAGGSLQVGTLTPPTFLLAFEGGVETLIVAGATLQTKANPTAGVVAREGAAIKTAADFRGKRVGAPGLNAIQHVTFLKWLANNNVDAKQVTFVEAPFPQMSDMLKGGQIDAALPVEPFLGRIIQAKTGYLVAHFTAEVSPSYLESFYVMPKSFVQANPKVAAEFREAIREAVAWIGANQEAARRTQITYLKLPEAVAMSIPLPTLTANVTPEEVQFWIDLCKDFGITKGTATVNQVLWR
ncbi:MAG: ABC transporter substrate-binding protein [Burkholderiales bacterium]|nr:ABC transporter substrate-binding protein [Burkholderiales bacterium]